MEKVAIITGATGGLGSNLAKSFGAAGAKIVVGYAKAQKEAEDLVLEIRRGPGEAFAFGADVRNYEQVKKMVEETVRRFHGVDVLVNLAGGTLTMLTNNENKVLLEHNDDEWDIVVDTNLKGSFNCIRAVAPQMIKQGGGHIVLVSSGIGIRPARLMSSYAAAKAGVFGLMKAAATELGEMNIKVNAVNPGLIRHGGLDLGGVNAEAATKERVLGRLSSVQDFSDFVVYLSQKDNISGQIFNVESRILF